MKRNCFGILLVVTGLVHCKNEEAVYRRKFIQLEHWAIHLTDGRTPGVDADAIVDCLQVRNLINKLQRGEPEKVTKTYTKIYDYQGTKVALDDLIAIEDELVAQGASYEDERVVEFQECLSKMKQRFIEFTLPLLGNAEIARTTNMHLIKEWCAKKGKSDCILLSWGSVDEEALLRKATAKQFRQFCIDLKDFLYDLMYSCPKGRECFKQTYLSPDKWDKFDADFKEIH